MQTLWRKFALFQLVPRAHHAPHRPRFSTWRCLNSSSTNCANFTRLLAMVWAAPDRKWRNVGTMATDKQTYRQTDAPSLNSYLDTAGRNRVADIGYEPPNLGCLVPPITRKKWTKTCMMMLFQSCYILLSGIYFTICATGMQFLVRISQIQVLDPPLCKLAAWNFQDICKNIFWERSTSFNAPVVTVSEIFAKETWGVDEIRPCQ